MTQILGNPRGAFRREKNPIADRPETLAGKTLGLVDNSKVNADLFLNQVEKRLCETSGVTKVLRVRKSVAGTPAPFTENFFAQCDVAVNAVGD